MNFFWKMYDDGDGGGGAGAAGPDPSSATTPPGAGAANAGSGGGEVGDGVNNNANNKPEKPTTPTVESLTAERDAHLKEIESLKKQVGKQGNDIGQFRKMSELLKSDPKGFLKKVASETGLKLNFDDGKKADPFEAALESGDPDAIAKAKQDRTLEQQKAVLKAELMQEIAPEMKAIRDAHLAQKYPDFDDFAEERTDIMALTKAGVIPTEELLHLAVRGKNLAEAVEAAKLQGREEYIAELNAKSGGNVDTSGDGGPGENKGIPSLADVLDKIPRY